MFRLWKNECSRAFLFLADPVSSFNFLLSPAYWLVDEFQAPELVKPPEHFVLRRGAGEKKAGHRVRRVVGDPHQHGANGHLKRNYINNTAFRQREIAYQVGDGQPQLLAVNVDPGLEVA